MRRRRGRTLHRTPDPVILTNIPHSQAPIFLSGIKFLRPWNAPQYFSFLEVVFMRMCACPCAHTCEGQDNFVCHSSSIIHLWVLRRVLSLARSLLRRLNQLVSEPQEPASPALFDQIPLTDFYVGSGEKTGVHMAST